jgi:misacylated tRNA(Ala) deacylase
MTEAVFRSQPYLKSITATVVAADERGVQFDRTIFYPTGGGQPGDTGSMTLPGGKVVAIANTIKGTEFGDVVHVLAAGAANPALGENVTLTLDWERRHRLMRIHTCLHLLSAVLPFPVTGGQVSDGKGRLDFDATGPVPDKDAITERLNELIAADAAVSDRWIDDAELQASPELVKTMSVKPPTGHGRVRLIEIAGVDRHVDLQACGGTHVARTGEIGRVAVRKIESKGKQNRRVSIEFA